MSPEEMIGSDDIEVAQLGVNILLETKSIETIKKLLSISEFYYRKDNDNKFLLYQFSHNKYSSVFIKDPTRTMLIELNNEKS